MNELVDKTHNHLLVTKDQTKGGLGFGMEQFINRTSVY
jgi:hypothetical protein